LTRIVTWDLETLLIRPGLRAPPPVCGVFEEPGAAPLLLAKDDAMDTLEQHLDAGSILIAHNGAFDFGVACYYRPHLFKKVFQAYRDGRVRDTQLRQRLLDIEAGLAAKNDEEGMMVFRQKGGQQIRSGVSLADLVYFYFDRDRRAQKKDPNSPRLRFQEVDGLPVSQYPKEFLDYVMADGSDTWAVFCAQDPSGSHTGAPLVDEVEQCRAAFVLHLMSCRGFVTDRAAVAKLKNEVWAKHEALQKKFREEGFYKAEKLSAEDRRNNRAPDFTAPDKKGVVKGWKYVRNMEVIKERVQAAYRAQGLDAPQTDKGATKTDSDALDLSGDPLLQEFGAGGPNNTIRNVFLPTLELGTSTPINTDFNVLVSTGRISSARPNLNNIPREGGVRECFTARPGFYLCSVDYDCAELRSHAQVNLWLFGRSAQAEFFQNDPTGDPHLELAASILGISTEEAKARKKLGDKEIKGVRQMCKALNFGLPGGMGVDRLIESARKGYNVKMTREEAQLRKRQWLERWPEMREYFDYVSTTVGLGGATIMQMRPGGKPHRKRGDVGYCDGANSLFQGLTADAAKHAAFLVSEECYCDETSPLYGSYPVGFLYDEVLAEVPIEKAHEAAHRLAEVMCKGAQEWLPDVPVTASPALMKVWSKLAEAVYDDKGRLIPWEPTPAPTNTPKAA
jgi:hypothetical protein